MRRALRELSSAPDLAKRGLVSRRGRGHPHVELLRMRQTVVLFFATRALLVATVLIAVALLAPERCPFCVDVSANPLLAALARWDGAAYLDIARDGYVGAGRENFAAYFPLYPLLMHVGGAIAGGSDDAYLIVGIIVANAAALVAAVGLLRLSVPRLEVAEAKRASAYLLIFPTTIFLSAVYADSLFLALAISSALAARDDRWWRSGLLAAGATLTRPFGGLAVIPLAFWLWRSRSTVDLRDVLAVVAAPVAFAAWLLYVYAVTGDPLAVIHGYASGFTPRHPLQAFTDLADPNVYHFPWFVAAAFVLFVLLVGYSWRVAGAEVAAYATAMLLVIGAAGSLTSSPRYELSIYPAFIALAVSTRRPLVRGIWIAISAALALIFTAMFALYYWVA
jgi:Mannosyltransferase (PIG-V)